MTIPSTATRLALGAALLAGAASYVRAQDSGPLIDALVKKGILSDQEAEDIRADLTRDFGQNTPAGKLDIATGVSRLRIAGDARVRYQYDNETANGAAGSDDRARYRYRFRLGVTADLGANWTTGVRFESANGATSTNADLGSGTDNFSKATDFAYVGQVFVTYKSSDLFKADSTELTFGKFAHKFLTPGVNGFWIDTDINFEGAGQELVYGDVFRSGDKLSLRSGQFLLNNNSSTTDGYTMPSLLHIEQVEYAAKAWRIAPSFVIFGAPSEHDRTITGAVNQANDTTVYNDLATVLVPFEYAFTLNDQPVAIYATYGYNLRGEERAQRLAHTATTAAQKKAVDDDSQLYNVGVRYGQSRNAGDYQLVGEYRHVGNGSYSSLLLDSDFNGGLLNASGYIFSASYNWTPAVVSTITYFNSFNIEEGRATGPNRGNGFGEAEVLQVDLSARF